MSRSYRPITVIAGLDPAIAAAAWLRPGGCGDARVKPGHDGFGVGGLDFAPLGEAGRFLVRTDRAAGAAVAS